MLPLQDWGLQLLLLGRVQLLLQLLPLLVMWEQSQLLLLLHQHVTGPLLCVSDTESTILVDA